MSFIKSKTTQFGVDADFWSITKAVVNPYPRPVEEVGGANSLLILSLFADEAAYLSGKPPIENKEIAVPYEVAIEALFSVEASAVSIAYNYIKSSDPFFADAVEV